MTVQRFETLPHLLSDLAQQYGDGTALIDGGETLTFAQLEDRASRLSKGLAELGVEPGDKVAVWLPNTLAWVELEFALARLGAVAVAINTMFRAHEVQDILARSGAQMLALWPGFKAIDFLSIVADLDAGQIPELQTLILLESDRSTLVETSLARMRTVDYAELFADERMDKGLGQPGEPCIAFTSSGTTSAPKLVLHSQRGISCHARAVAEAFSYADPDCVVLGMLPFCGVFGFNTVMGAIAAGTTAVLMPIFDAEEAVRLIEAHEVTHTNGTDDMLRRILAAAPPDRIPSLREVGFASFSGDPKQLVAKGDSLGKRFYQLYGSSEVQALMARQPADADAERRALGGGIPVSGEIDVRARDGESGELLPQEESGELEIRGPNVMIGYINNPQAEKETFTDDGYIRTGDLGYLTEDGFVYLTRLGDTLRLSGFLVSPREIEAYLEGLPGIAAAQVVGASTERGARPVAFVVMEEVYELDEAGVIDRCQEGMAKFKVPKRVIALEDFPTVDSANGPKVQRNRLREMAEKALEDGEAKG